MAESVIDKLICKSQAVRVNAASATADVSKYKDGTNTGGFAFLVAARSWAGQGFEHVGSLYLVSGIQNGLYQSCVAIVKESTYAPTVTLSGDTLTVKYINASGGFYAIIPLFNLA